VLVLPASPKPIGNEKVDDVVVLERRVYTTTKSFIFQR
jgi:hypothetical protein